MKTVLAIIAVLTATGLVTPALAQPTRLDSLAAGIERQVDLGPVFNPVYSPLDTVRNRQYLTRHSLSLDNFLETQPGYFMGRLGPIGATALFSRLAMGRGRGQVFLGLVPLNDPQDDIAQLQVAPTTAIEELVLDGQPSAYLPVFQNIEGTIHIVPPEPISRKPTTFLELATGDRDLRQRRVRFSTPRRTVGVDIAYDDLRDNGYYFDGTETVGGSDNYGSSATRGLTLNVRGNLKDEQAYLMSFRQFQTTFQGDLESSTADTRRNGHVGLLEADIGLVRVAMFETGNSLTAPDSVTENRTLAFAMTAPVGWLPEQALQLGFTGEEIQARQRIGGGRDDRPDATDQHRGEWAQQPGQRGVGALFGFTPAPPRRRDWVGRSRGTFSGLHETLDDARAAAELPHAKHG